MSKSHFTLTQAALKELLRFDPESGDFYWIRPTATHTARGAKAGGVDNRGYWRIRLFGKAYAAHRLAWLYEHGCWPAADLDHLNGDRLDNRLANLRDVSRSVNMQNLRQPRATSKSGLLGVRMRQGRYEARIVVGGVRRVIGLYQTPDEAHLAYLTVKRSLHDGCTI